MRIAVKASRRLSHSDQTSVYYVGCVNSSKVLIVRMPINVIDYLKFSEPF